MRTVLMAAFALLAMPAMALQTLSTRPDGDVTIRTSVNDVTRLSVAGDRIRRLVNDGSQYEMTNDQETGDAFLRFAGTGTPDPETGFIITEKGVTIAYTLIGKSGASKAETVLITVKGGPKTATPKISEPLLGSAAGAFVSTSGSHASGLAGFMRETIQTHIADRTLTTGRNGTVIKTVNGPGLRARILVGRAGANATMLRHQSYYKPGVLAVWIAKVALSPRERTQIIVVEKR